VLVAATTLRDEIAQMPHPAEVAQNIADRFA
jgi:hypothetical protein